MKLKEVKDTPLLTAPPRMEVWWELTDDDRGLLREALNGARERPYGIFLANVHYVLRELGLKEPVTDRDMEGMRGQMHEYIGHSGRW